MSFLLDTHALIWFIEGSTRLSQHARTLIEEENNELFLSAASLWEMAIKVSLGKLGLRDPYAVLIPEQLAENEILLLDITD